jgi:hypothetical protein
MGQECGADPMPEQLQLNGIEKMDRRRGEHVRIIALFLTIISVQY